MYHDCVSVIVSRITFLIEGFVICCYQVTKISTQGAASPVRFLQGPLVILVSVYSGSEHKYGASLMPLS